ncbi:hypothetical protein Patl1_28078 [Pistacia atlantica]|uniref:Uncharacterized protein n=1 Tax=Pistacia atlantica TaxID=434234 RepID=A0ACC1BF19_9ROSI|nr:hypothetical protein Patl1_28078 [Pistacia atlantica]
MAHFVGLRYDQQKPEGFEVGGIILIHLYFLGNELISVEVNHLERREFVEKFWRFVYPVTNGCDCLLFNMLANVKLARLESCRCRVMDLMVVEKEKNKGENEKKKREERRGRKEK